MAEVIRTRTTATKINTVTGCESAVTFEEVRILSLWTHGAFTVTVLRDLVAAIDEQQAPTNADITVIRDNDGGVQRLVVTYVVARTATDAQEAA